MECCIDAFGVTYHLVQSRLKIDVTPIIMPRGGATAYGSSFVCQSLCRGRSYGGIL